MGDDQSGKKETRSVLGDISNQKQHLGKRGFSSISSSPTSGVKSVFGNKMIADSKSEDNDAHFWKQVTKAVESLEKERYGSGKCPKVVNESSGLSPLSGGKVYRLRTSSSGGSIHGKPQTLLTSPVREVVVTSGSRLDKIDVGKGPKLLSVANLGDIFKPRIPKVEHSQGNYREVGKECQGDLSGSGENVVNLGNTIKESIPSVIVSESSNPLECKKECHGDEETLVISDTGENDCTQESLTTKVMSNDGKTVVSDSLPSNRCESVVSSRLIESNDKEPLGLKRCKVLKGDGSSSAADLDMLKSCSCSFCTKAAYIWSDLHYQDVKGRISVLTKSQEKATNLAQKYSVENNQGQSMREANLENHLTGQWKSLFLHMKNIFATESGQLQSDLIALKDLRENFKTTSDSNTGMPSDAQQCSSGASDHSAI